MKSFRSSSEEKTKKIATNLASKILKQKKDTKSATVIALSGELGAGKTVFSKGFLGVLGVKDKVVSPTFIISRRFPVNIGRFKSAYHIDAYRLKEKDASGIDLPGIMADKENLVLIEWPENVKRFIPKNATWIYFEHDDEIDTRNIRIGA